MAVKKRSAGAFTSSIGHDEWMELTVWRPLLVGGISGGVSLALGFVAGWLAHTCGW